MVRARFSITQRPLRCVALVPKDEVFDPVRETIAAATKRAGARLVFSSHLLDGLAHSPSLQESFYAEMRGADLVFVDLSQPTPSNFYELGFAQAIGKPIVFLANERARRQSVLYADVRRSVLIAYRVNSRGLSRLRNDLVQVIKEFKLAPGRFQAVSPTAAAMQPYPIELETLTPRQFENLCFELLTQMGLRRIEWGVTIREVDVLATLPRKDPDGYQYDELWMVLIGRGGERRPPTEMLIDMAAMEPDSFIEGILRYSERKESPIRIRPESPITLLVIAQNDSDSERFEEYVRHVLPRQRLRRFRTNVRIRVWESRYVTGLIQQYPQIAYKYFSEAARIRGEYRKTYEELYRENAMLTERIQATVSALEEEKKRRFIAERDAAWKDVAFKAAHKLGNPIDAVDTYLPSLKKRIESKKSEEAIRILDDISVSIEEAKGVIAQFKSLVKAQQVSTQPLNIELIIEQACKKAREKGVKVQIHSSEKIVEVMADPERMSDVFNELVANSLHWFNKPDRKIEVYIDKPIRRKLPSGLDKSRTYLRVHFSDNGSGVSSENKEKIFAPFFTTYPHGTGLGLSLVKWIIEEHRGFIIENGKPGKGASFEIYLPTAKKKRS